MKSNFMAKLQIAFISGLLACLSSAFAAGGPGGGAGGGGGGKAPLAFPSANSISIPSEIPAGGYSLSATSGNAQPTITLVSSSFPELAIGASVTNIPSGKAGPLNRTVVQLTRWTPTRAQIGTGTVVFTASDGLTSLTYTLTITVLDAPETVTGLTAASDGSQISASWIAPAAGGTGAISYNVVACYQIFIRTGAVAAQCETIGTAPITSVVFPAISSTAQNNPSILVNGGKYLEVLVTPVDSVGVSGPMTQFLLP